MVRASGGGFRRLVAGFDQPLPLAVPVSRRAAHQPRPGDEPANRRLRIARETSAHELSQICRRTAGLRRLRLELALPGQASWAANAVARLDLLAVRGTALRDAECERFRSGRRGLVRRLSEDKRA